MRAGVLALALLAAPGATAATLRSSDVLLQDQQVRLSDLFDGVVRDQAIGPSPDPGGRIVVEQAQLAAIARQFGVDWRPASTADRVVLQRPGRLYPREPVMAALREALLNAGVPATAEIETPALNPPMVPPDESARPEVTQAFYDSVTGRFTALLSITATNMAPFNARLSGHVQEMVEVEVATRRIAAGDIIGGGDVQVARLRAGLVRAEAARVPEQVVGMAMRHPLSAGAPILLADLGRPDLVQRGSPVEVKLNMPGLSVTVQGVAMEPGGAGDRVHVLNPNSRAVMEAEVTGPLQVRMSGGANPVLLAPGGCGAAAVVSSLGGSLMAGFAPAAGLLLALALGGCGALQALSEVGRPPEMSPSSDPTADPKWRPMTMPMPRADLAPDQVNSLWRSGSRAFFKDQRAAQVGDILTVLVNITDAANFQNGTTATRTGTESEGVPSFFGLETQLPKIISRALSPASLVSTSSTNTNTGTGTIKRDETVTLRLAGVVTQVLPNGNLVVAARQEVRVNAELRQLQVSGVVRPQDIASDNTVLHDRMAEARISYGGRGTLTQLQQPRYGQQLLDILLPF